MSTVKFTRPDGRSGTYGQWAAEIAAKWTALGAAEQAASRDAAATRLSAQIRAQADGEPTLMHLYDEIGWFGVWPADVVEALNGIKGSVEVHLNSPGGNVFDGLAIYEALKQHPGDVGVVVDGLAASAASFIAMAASPGQLQMTPHGTVMIHDAWGMCIGDAAEMADMAALLDRTSDNIASIYAERGGRTAGEFRDLMKAETWALGQEAVDLRLADSVRKPPADSPAAPVPLAAELWQVTILARPEPPGPVPPAPADHADPGFEMDPATLMKALEEAFK
jgi:ATP-dependent Clp endopeptidase proteolytic subunit ClpP